MEMPQTPASTGGAPMSPSNPSEGKSNTKTWIIVIAVAVVIVVATLFALGVLKKQEVPVPNGLSEHQIQSQLQELQAIRNAQAGGNPAPVTNSQTASELKTLQKTDNSTVADQSQGAVSDDLNGLKALRPPREQ